MRILKVIRKGSQCSNFDQPDDDLIIDTLSAACAAARLLSSGGDDADVDVVPCRILSMVIGGGSFVGVSAAVVVACVSALLLCLPCIDDWRL